MATLRSAARVAPATQASRPRTVVVRAQAEQVDRRAILGLVAGAIGAALVPQAAQAITLPSQNFTGGLVKGGGAVPKSATAATMEGYTLEGTKKPSYIPAKKKKAMLAKAREQAVQVAQK